MKALLPAHCLAVILIAMFSGCTGTIETETSSENNSNAESTVDDSKPDSQVGSVNQNKTEQSPAAIPDDFPRDIPVVSGAKSVDFREVGGKENLILEYAAADDHDAFVKGFLDKISEQGWTKVTSSELPIGTITNFSKDDRKCTVSISPPKNDMIKVAIVLTTK